MLSTKLRTGKKAGTKKSAPSGRAKNGPASNGAKRRNAQGAGVPAWARYSDDQLLELRFCDLKLKIEGTELEERVERVREELQRRRVDFRPHFWLSSEWFTPDGVPGVAIPFYLAHPRLKKLEEAQMFECEGGTEASCMRLLRHELGHAIANAYRLYRKRSWQAVFGKSSDPYPNFYQPKPYSKRYVLHLDYWYAQSHPTEDFAETFAVWLTPNYSWRKRYAGWPALKKLKFVDELMSEIAGTKPLVTSRECSDRIDGLRMTLKRHYQNKRKRYGTDYPDFYDRDLRQLFSEAKDCPEGESAARLLNRVRPEIRRMLSRWTGEYQYTIDQVLQEMIVRCRELSLRVHKPTEAAKLEATIMLTMQIMNYLHDGHHRLAV